MDVFIKYYQATRKAGNSKRVSIKNAYILYKELNKDMHEMNYITILSRFLDKEVIVPMGRKMILKEIYSNGNVACVPLECKSYFEELKEFHANSIKLI